MGTCSRTARDGPDGQFVGHSTSTWDVHFLRTRSAAGLLDELDYYNP
ncbi:hypothetical protein ACFQ7M_40355 [Streptomyces massasporeus]